jgi:hypothetical protein
VSKPAHQTNAAGYSSIAPSLQVVDGAHRRVAAIARRLRAIAADRKDPDAVPTSCIDPLAETAYSCCWSKATPLLPNIGMPAFRHKMFPACSWALVGALSCVVAKWPRRVLLRDRALFAALTKPPKSVSAQAGDDPSRGQIAFSGQISGAARSNVEGQPVTLLPGLRPSLGRTHWGGTRRPTPAGASRPQAGSLQPRPKPLSAPRISLGALHCATQFFRARQLPVLENITFEGGLQFTQSNQSARPGYEEVPGLIRRLTDFGWTSSSSSVPCDGCRPVGPKATPRWALYATPRPAGAMVDVPAGDRHR